MSSLVTRLVSAFVTVVVVLAAGISIAFVKKSGGIREVLQLPAVVAGSDAKKQNGFTLVAVTRGRPDDSDVTLPNGAKMFLAAEQSSGDTVLWIAPPLLPPTRLLRATTIRDSGQLQSFYDIEVVSSEGDRFRIPWHYEGGCLEGGGEPCIDTRVASFSPHIITALIPAGYPAGITYFDVSISDPFGRTAHWRLIDLPKMQPATPKKIRPTFSRDGASVTLTATRSPIGGAPGSWPLVNLFMTVSRLAPTATHHWALFQKREALPTLSWEPTKLPWMRSTADQNSRHPVNEFWLLSHDQSFTDQFMSIPSPYVKNNDTATFHGVLSQYETRVDSIRLRNVVVEKINARDAGFTDDAYCISLPHRLELISGSGLTFVLPAQRRTLRNILLMAPDSLNILWRLSPVTPGHNSDTAALLPDSPLCKKYNRPVAVWFEASADGKPLGVCAGLPDRSDVVDSVMVHFPATIPLPPIIHDLKITVDQRLDIQRIPITLTARIKDVMQ